MERPGRYGRARIRINGWLLLHPKLVSSLRTACGGKLSETEFVPSKGSRNHRRLIGQRGRGTRKRVADFYKLPGFYVLIYKGKAEYFGIAPKTGVGQRIYEHLRAGKKKFDEFSWFGYGNMKPNVKNLEVPSTEVLPPLTHRRSVRDFER
jgi:hypothetical protein